MDRNLPQQAQTESISEDHRAGIRLAAAIEAEIRVDPIIRSSSERRSVMVALFSLLEDAERRDPPIRRRGVLSAAGVGTPEDSTKRLIRFVVDPSWDREKQLDRARNGTQDARKYLVIAHALAALTGDDRDDLVAALFENTRFLKSYDMPAGPLAKEAAADLSDGIELILSHVDVIGELSGLLDTKRRLIDDEEIATGRHVSGHGSPDYEVGPKNGRPPHIRLPITRIIGGNTINAGLVSRFGREGGLSPIEEAMAPRCRIVPSLQVDLLVGLFGEARSPGFRLDFSPAHAVYAMRATDFPDGDFAPGELIGYIKDDLENGLRTIVGNDGESWFDAQISIPYDLRMHHLGIIARRSNAENSVTLDIKVFGLAVLDAPVESAHVADDGSTDLPICFGKPGRFRRAPTRNAGILPNTLGAVLQNAVFGTSASTTLASVIAGEVDSLRKEINERLETYRAERRERTDALRLLYGAPYDSDLGMRAGN